MELKEFVAGLAEQFEETDAQEVTPECHFQELDEWSSLTALSIIAFIKTSYDKTVSGREIRACQTVSDLFELVASK